jgi:hypothetical protein
MPYTYIYIHTLYCALRSDLSTDLVGHLTGAVASIITLYPTILYNLRYFLFCALTTT